MSMNFSAEPAFPSSTVCHKTAEVFSTRRVSQIAMLQQLLSTSHASSANELARIFIGLKTSPAEILKDLPFAFNQFCTCLVASGWRTLAVSNPFLRCNFRADDRKELLIAGLLALFSSQYI